MTNAIRDVLLHLFNEYRFIMYYVDKNNTITVLFSLRFDFLLAFFLVMYFCIYIVLLWRYAIKVVFNDF